MDQAPPPTNMTEDEFKFYTLGWETAREYYSDFSYETGLMEGYAEQPSRSVWFVLGAVFAFGIYLFT